MVIDGKQRLTALVKFFASEIPAEFRDGLRVLYKDLELVSQRKVKMSSVAIGICGGMTQAEIIDFYLALNEGGTVHTEAEINRVRALLEAPTGAP